MFNGKGERINLASSKSTSLPRLFITGDVQNSYTGTSPKVKYDYYSDDVCFSCYGTIKVQGSSSRSYPKKNFTIKLYSDENLTSSHKVEFKEWGKRSKFVIKANWIDITHSRNICTANLWSHIVASRKDYASLPLQLRNSSNNGAVDGFPILVFINGDYWGRYTINIPKDENLFGMDKTLSTHCVLCGEDYKKTCFQELPVLCDGTDWSDEIHDVCPQNIVTKWNEISSFIMNSSDTEFTSKLGSYIDLTSVIDFYILAYVDCGIDNLGRNMIAITYDGDFWYLSAYDLDSTWGLSWNGNLQNDPELPMQSGYQSITQYPEGNRLFVKLERCFKTQIKARYAELRADVLSNQHILNIFEDFCSRTSKELIEEDYASTTATTNTEGLFTGIKSVDTNNIQQLRAFIRNRLVYVDGCINSL